MRFRALQTILPICALLFLVTGCPKGGGGGGMQNPGGGQMQPPNGGMGFAPPQGRGMQGPPGGPGGGIAPPRPGQGQAMNGQRPGQPGTPPGTRPGTGLQRTNGSTNLANNNHSGATRRRSTRPQAKPKADADDDNDEAGQESSGARQLLVRGDSGSSRSPRGRSKPDDDDAPGHGSLLAGLGSITGGLAGEAGFPVLDRVQPGRLGQPGSDKIVGDIDPNDGDDVFESMNAAVRDGKRTVKWTENEGNNNPVRGRLADQNGRHPTSTSALCEKTSRSDHFSTGKTPLTPDSVTTKNFKDSNGNEGPYTVYVPKKIRSKGLITVLPGDTRSEASPEAMKALANATGRTVMVIEPIGDKHPKTNMTSFAYDRREGNKRNDAHIFECVEDYGNEHPLDKDDADVVSWSSGASAFNSDMGEKWGQEYQGLALMACGTSMKTKAPIPERGEILAGFHPYYLTVDGDDVNPYAKEQRNRFEEAGVACLNQAFDPKDEGNPHCNFPLPIAQIAANKIVERDRKCNQEEAGSFFAMDTSKDKDSARHSGTH